MILDPAQTLDSLNLSLYEVLDCEPLHDLKGHTTHLLKELPHLLPSQLKQQCKQIIDSTASKPANGAQLRLACVKVFLKLYKESSQIDEDNSKDI